MKISAVETVIERLYVESDIDETMFDNCESEDEVMELLEDIFDDNSEVIDSEYISTEHMDIKSKPILEYWRKIKNK